MGQFWMPIPTKGGSLLHAVLHLWAWTIPDLFPGAVEQGLVAKEISWYTSLKVAIFVAALAVVAGIRRGEKS